MPEAKTTTNTTAPVKPKPKKPRGATITSDGRVHLTPEQETFCRLYATDREFFGNGTRAYIEAYGVNLRKKFAYAAARASASRLLTSANICDRINEILEEGGLSDTFVDKQLLFLVTQHKDFAAKIRAIQEYNKLKSRIVERHKVEGLTWGDVIGALDEVEREKKGNGQKAGK